MKRILFAACAMFLATIIHAQYLEVEIDSVHMGTYMSSQGEVDLTGYVTFSVWAYVPDASDCVTAIVGGIEDVGSDLNCGNEDDLDNLNFSFDGSLFNDPIAGVNSSQQICQLFAAFPALYFDSFVTFGACCATDGGSLNVIGLPCDDTDLTVFGPSGNTPLITTGSVSIDNGGWFTLPGGFDSNSIAGSDLRVKIAQITTNGGFCMSGWMGYQVTCTPGFPIITTWFDLCHEMPCSSFGDDLSYFITPEEDGESFTIEITGGDGIITSEVYTMYDELVSSGGTTHAGLPPGQYHIEVFSSYGCVYNIADVIIEQLAPLGMQLMQNDDTVCESGIEDHIEAEITGGWPPYSVEVNGISTTQNVKWIAFGENASGINTIVVTDALGTVAEINFNDMDDDDAMLNTSINPATCFGDSDGSVSVNSSSAFESIDWNTDQNGSGISNLEAGIYFYLAVDASGCAVYEGAVVNEFPIITSTVEITSVSCLGDEDGTAIVQLSGGTGDYSLSWNGYNPLALAPGIYTFTATDSNGCLYEDEVTITEPDALSFDVIEVTDESSEDAEDGMISIEISGGTEPYEILWSNGETGPIAGNLTAGSISFTVTDANGCVLEDGFVVEVGIAEQLAENILIQYLSQSHSVAITSPHDGSKTITIFDSSGRLVLSEDFSAQQHEVAVAFLSAGFYSVQVVDESGIAMHQFVRE